MQNEDLKYFILDEIKRPLYVNTDGNIESSTGVPDPAGNTLHLKNAPDGWSESLVKYKRNPKALGSSREYSNPLKFIRDGAKILKDSMWRTGVDVVRYLAIWKLNKIIFPDTYNHWGTFEFDFSTHKQSNEGFTIELKDGGLSKNFVANQNTTYEIDIHDDADKKTLFLDGLTLVQNAKFLVFDGLSQSNGQHTLNLEILSEEAISEIGASSTERQHFKNNTELLGQNNCFLKTGAKPVTITLKYNFGFNVELATGITPNPVAGGQMLIRCFDQNNVATDAFILENYGGASNLYTHHTLNNEVTITIPAKRKCFLAQFLTLSGVIASGSGADEVVFWTYDSTTKDVFNIEYSYIHAHSFAECLQPKKLCEKIIKKIYPSATVSSTLLDSLNDSVLLSSGQAIRKYGAMSVIKTSIEDFIQWARFYGIGWTIEGDVFILEKHEWFFKNNKVANLGVVNNWEIYTADDLVSNSYKFGYPNVDLGKVNSRDEFNVTNQFVSPLKRQISELNLVSPYHAGMYEIEVIRIDLNGKDTTDDRVDNTVFKFDVEKGYTFDYYDGDIYMPFQNEIQLPGSQESLAAGDVLTISGAASNNGSYNIGGFFYATGTTDITFGSNVFTGTPITINGAISIQSINNYKLARPAFDSVTGLLHPEDAFNIPSRPKNAFYNNGGYIRSINDNHDAESIVWTSGDKNSTLSTTIGTITVTENANEPIGGLAPQLFKPYYISCDANISDEDWDIINANQYSLIDITVKDQTFSVYKWDGSRNPVTKKCTGLVFLFGPDNDMSKLIKI